MCANTIEYKQKNKETGLFFDAKEYSLSVVFCQLTM